MERTKAHDGDILTIYNTLYSWIVLQGKVVNLETTYINCNYNCLAEVMHTPHYSSANLPAIWHTYTVYI